MQTLAIRADRTLYLTGGPTSFIPPIPESLAGTQVSAVGMGRNHGLAIDLEGQIHTWGLLTAREGAPTTGHFVAVTGGGLHSVALGKNGKVVVWGGLGDTGLLGDRYAVVGVGAPAGIEFTAIAARGRYTLALAADGNIYGWGADAPPPAPLGVVAGVFESAWTPNGRGHHIAPMDPGNPYVAIAAGLDLVVALRADRSLAVWDTTGLMPAPPVGVFTHIAAGFGYAVAIDEAGDLHAWGKVPLNAAPAGRYSGVSAAGGHAAAIAVPDPTPPVVTILEVDPCSIWPPTHKMTPVSVTFRAEGSSPVLLSGLSVTLRSNQPDTGFGSGNTTGDTNGADGYTSGVLLPATAIVENADGTFTATFEVRAEAAAALAGSRRYTVSIRATDTAIPSKTSATVPVQIVVGRGGR